MTQVLAPIESPLALKMKWRACLWEYPRNACPVLATVPLIVFLIAAASGELSKGLPFLGVVLSIAVLAVFFEILARRSGLTSSQQRKLATRRLRDTPFPILWSQDLKVDERRKPVPLQVEVRLEDGTRTIVDIPRDKGIQQVAPLSEADPPMVIFPHASYWDDGSLAWNAEKGVKLIVPDSFFDR